MAIGSLTVLSAVVRRVIGPRHGRRELEEAQNRIDFAERLLAQGRQQGKLPPGGS